jgi:hypothetical protein
MHIMPELMIDGLDVSRYFLSCHAEQSANGAKDPGKYDLVLANVGGRFNGAFAPKAVEAVEQEQLGTWSLAPKKKVSLRMISTKWGCEETAQSIVTIFSGEIQKAEADELFVRIEGSCTEGGMTSYIKTDKTFFGWTNTDIVNWILDQFGGITTRHIYPANDLPPDKTPELKGVFDFDTCLYLVAQWAQSIYFFDENDEFWFVPAADNRGFQDLTGNILRGSQANNLVGYCNWVEVYGGSYKPLPFEDGSEAYDHNLIFAIAKAPDLEIQQWNGFIKAPPVYYPNLNQEQCQVVADNLLQWYRQYKDVPSVRVVGKAPGLLSKVSFMPWNGSIPPIACDGAEEAELGLVEGLVTRRVVDISADTGFIATLDVATNFMQAGVYAGNATSFKSDPAIKNNYPGVI